MHAGKEKLSDHTGGVRLKHDDEISALLFLGRILQQDIQGSVARKSKYTALIQQAFDLIEANGEQTKASLAGFQAYHGAEMYLDTVRKLTINSMIWDKKLAPEYKRAMIQLGSLCAIYYGVYYSNQCDSDEIARILIRSLGVGAELTTEEEQSRRYLIHIISIIINEVALAASKSNNGQPNMFPDVIEFEASSSQPISPVLINVIRILYENHLHRTENYMHKSISVPLENNIDLVNQERRILFNRNIEKYIKLSLQPQISDSSLIICDDENSQQVALTDCKEAVLNKEVCEKLAILAEEALKKAGFSFNKHFIELLFDKLGQNLRAFLEFSSPYQKAVESYLKIGKNIAQDQNEHYRVPDSSFVEYNDLLKKFVKTVKEQLDNNHDEKSKIKNLWNVHKLFLKDLIELVNNPETSKQFNERLIKWILIRAGCQDGVQFKKILLDLNFCAETMLDLATEKDTKTNMFLTLAKASLKENNTAKKAKWYNVVASFMSCLCCRPTKVQALNAKTGSFTSLSIQEIPVAKDKGKKSSDSDNDNEIIPVPNNMAWAEQPLSSSSSYEI